MISVDLGQSGCRIYIDGEIISTSRGKLAGEPVIDALEANFKDLKTKSEKIALSLTGLFGDVGDCKPFFELCSRHFGANEVAVIDDGLASLAGALAGRSGVSLTLGGGVVAVAGNGEKLSHSDGLGSHFGDEGGGFWLGSRGLTRALAARDGREKNDSLINIFSEELNFFDALQSKNGTDASSLAIACAKKVLESENHVLDLIRHDGAERLAKTIISAWHKVSSQNQKFYLTITGGLSRNEDYKTLIFSKLNELGADANLVDAAGDNLDGAIWIANNWESDIRPMLGWARA